MKNKRKNKIFAKIILTAMIFMMLCAGSALSTQAASNGKPLTFINGKFVNITKGKVNKNNVKKGDTFQYSFTIKNTGLDKLPDDEDTTSFLEAEDIHVVELVWQSPKKQSIVHRYMGKYNRKTKTYKISGKIKINKGMQQGTWKLESIAMYSVNVYDMGDSDFYSAYAYIYNTKAWNKYVVDEYSEYMDLSFADFTVKGTGKKLDKEGPTLSMKSLKLSKKTLKKGLNSKFSLKANDKSGMIRKVTCGWLYYGVGLYNDRNGEIEECEMKYNQKKKTYECYVGLWLNDRKAKLNYIILEDCYGNKRTYYWDDGGKELYSKKKKIFYWSEKGGKEKLSSWGIDFNDKYKKYSLKKKDKKALKEMVITRKKKYLKK